MWVSDSPNTDRECRASLVSAWPARGQSKFGVTTRHDEVVVSTGNRQHAPTREPTLQRKRDHVLGARDWREDSEIGAMHSPRPLAVLQDSLMQIAARGTGRVEDGDPQPHRPARRLQVEVAEVTSRASFTEF